MIERKIFCPSCRSKIVLQCDPLYKKSDVKKCEKCGLSLQMSRDGEINLCYESAYKVNPETGEKYIPE
jgi:transcription elongation factor Elf1